MVSDIYYRLRERMNEYSVGFRATESGIELKLLEKLFTEEEAAMYLNLTDNLQTAKDIAEKTGQDPAEVEEILQRMTEKGQTFPRFPKKEGEPFYYAAAPFAHGLLEHQVKRLDKETAELFDQYHRAVSGVFATKPVIPLRTLPVNTALTPNQVIASYDDLKKIIANMNRIALAPCVCNEMQRQLGKTCDQPTEVCMMFGFYADYYIARGMGRPISNEEALRKLDECQKAGLIPQISNSEKPEALCNCCPDCCGGLRAIKRFPKPGLMVGSNYFAQVDTGLCTGCGSCVDRCFTGAIAMGKEETAEINLERCVGCGVCVSTCPVEALSLARKPEDTITVPPQKGLFMKSSEEFEDQVKQ